jgi:hypothetical protein
MALQSEPMPIDQSAKVRIVEDIGLRQNYLNPGIGHLEVASSQLHQ